MKQIMITAMHSGAGKTVITCSLLAALKKRGMDVHAFKCGPDYIDPMFHTGVLGIPSRNLDLFLQGRDAVRSAVALHGGEIAVLEGAMGYYDGLNGTDEASAFALADVLSCPAVLVVRPQGSMLTLAAQIRGLAAFRSESHLEGILLNGCRESLAGSLTPVLERETGLPVLGFLPPMEEAVLESRHLGLLTAGEINNLTARFEVLSAQMERTMDLDALLDLASPYLVYHRCGKGRSVLLLLYRQPGSTGKCRSGARFFQPLAGSHTSRRDRRALSLRRISGALCCPPVRKHRHAAEHLQCREQRSPDGCGMRRISVLAADAGKRKEGKLSHVRLPSRNGISDKESAAIRL